MEEKNKGKGLLDSLRTFGLVVSLLAVILVLFSMASFVTTIGTSVKNSVTGEVILIQGPENKEIDVDIKSKEVLKELDDNLICWIEGGVQEQDVIVVGNLLKGVACPEGSKKNVSSKYEDNCLIISVEDEGDVELCSEEDKPNVNLDLVSSPEYGDDFFPEDVKILEKNLYWYILFFIILIVLVLFWREYEFNIKPDVEALAEKAYLKRREQKKQLRKLRNFKKQEEVVRIGPAPIYDEKKWKKEIKEKEKIEEKLEEEGLKKRGSLDAKRNKLIAKFNHDSDKINELIVAGKLEESRKDYLNLFSVYSDLINLVSKKNRETIDRMMEYLCNYLGALETTKGKKIGVREKLDDKEDKKIKPKQKLLTMNELDDMKELLKNKNYEKAKGMFYSGDVERMGLKDAVRNVTSKKEKDDLDEIESRHNKILRKGVINVDEDDYYRFMSDMSQLRKELKKGLMKNKKKG